MRAFLVVLCTALGGLWGWYAFRVAPRDTTPPAAVRAPDDDGSPSAASLNNTGVRLHRQGRDADALLYFERAHAFRPRDPVLAANVARQRARVERDAWRRVLAPGTALAVLLLIAAVFRGAWRRVRDAAHLRRLRLRGDAWVRIRPDAAEAELPLRFSRPVGSLLRRHPLTIVWSSAGRGKHMKSRPPVETHGKHAVVRLDRTRLDRLREYPGDWRGFLYVGKAAVGEPAARVG